MFEHVQSSFWKAERRRFRNTVWVSFYIYQETSCATVEYFCIQNYNEKWN